MNIQQLEYIVAVDSCRHFVKAAEKCFVTQATLSMMVKKLEEELGVKIFDRSRQPVIPTDIGMKVIEQAKIILHETGRLTDIVKEEQGEFSGELRIGIIPTLAPYLLPLFMPGFMKKYPAIKLIISEQTTDSIIANLEQNNLDVGLLSLPIQNASIVEHSLFFEEFVLYASDGEKILEKEYILKKDINLSRLCLLEEGHCLRTQVFNLCTLQKEDKEGRQLDFETGSIETLKRIVDIQGGMTILPSLALNYMEEKKKKNTRYFKSPAPVREIGLVTYRYFIKEKLIEKLKKEIVLSVPASMLTKNKRQVINI
ncbi:MAG: LysR substrate-binding domain-containing protein [Ginsengibacter sp.]